MQTPKNCVSNVACLAHDSQGAQVPRARRRAPMVSTSGRGRDAGSGRGRGPKEVISAVIQRPGMRCHLLASENSTTACSNIRTRDKDFVFANGGAAPPPTPPLCFYAVQACFQEHRTMNKNWFKHVGVIERGRQGQGQGQGRVRAGAGQGREPEGHRRGA